MNDPMMNMTEQDGFPRLRSEQCKIIKKKEEQVERKKKGKKD